MNTEKTSVRSLIRPNGTPSLVAALLTLPVWLAGFALRTHLTFLPSSSRWVIAMAAYLTVSYMIGARLARAGKLYGPLEWTDVTACPEKANLAFELLAYVGLATAAPLLFLGGVGAQFVLEVSVALRARHLNKKHPELVS